MGKGKKRRLRELAEAPPAAPATELPEHDLTFPHSATMLRVDPAGTGGCSARCPRRVAVDRQVLADASLTPAMREAFTEPIRYAVARYGSAAAGAAAWWEARAELPGEPMPAPAGPAAGPTRSHICTRPDACRHEPPQDGPQVPTLAAVGHELARRHRAAQDETPQQRATRLDRERDEAGKAYRAAIHAADEAWREIGGRQ